MYKYKANHQQFDIAITFVQSNDFINHTAHLKIKTFLGGRYAIVLC